LVQSTTNNDSDDDEGITVELYHAMEIAQQKRRSNDGYKNHQLMEDKLETKIAKQFETYNDECSRLDLEEYVLLYKIEKYDTVTKKVQNLLWKK
jgi:hypothetical protein